MVMKPSWLYNKAGDFYLPGVEEDEAVAKDLGYDSFADYQESWTDMQFVETDRFEIGWRLLAAVVFIALLAASTCLAVVWMTN